MPNKDFFLDRCLKSILEQTYKNYEIIITENGKMAENHSHSRPKLTAKHGRHLNVNSQ